MLSVLAFKPVVGFVIAILMLGYDFLSAKNDNVIRLRLYFFITTILLVDLFLGFLLWFSSYSAMDFIFSVLYAFLLITLLVTRGFKTRNLKELENDLAIVENTVSESTLDWATPYLIQKPSNLFLTQDNQRIIQSKYSKLMILGPHGSGKETLATLCAFEVSENVVKVEKSNLDEIITRISDLANVAFLLPDVQSYFDFHFDKLMFLCSTKSSIYATSSDLDILDRFPFFNSFHLEYIKPLTFEEFLQCFEFFKPKELQVPEIKWESVAALLKLIYVPQVKQIVQFSLDEMELDQSGVLQKIHLAKALEKFLRITV